MKGEKIMYIAIDLKSFYASVECVERGLDPLTTNLVVADISRTEKTICLAVSPSLKSYGLPGRPRLFEVVQQVGRINSERRKKCGKYGELPKSYDNNILTGNESVMLDYIVAQPQMALYIKYSTRIYGIYLKYVAPEDIHVYSCDEVFINASPYLDMYKCSARELAVKMVRDVLSQTGITATAGVGTNMYLCKVAMDIVAKHMPTNADGVRVAELDEKSYREKLWEHTPLTDFWGFGKGITARLEKLGIHNMGDICLQSEKNEEVLYNEFGVKAETIIDHAWGYEPCTISDIRAYKPKNKSMSQGQVLSCAYSYHLAYVIVKEMAESLVLDIVRNKAATNQVVLTVGYDSGTIPYGYDGEISSDHYGRRVPKAAHGSINIKYTSSTRKIVHSALELYRRTVNPSLKIRRINITANNIIREDDIPEEFVQLELFGDQSCEINESPKESKHDIRERSLQNAMISLKDRYGKNAVMKAVDYTEGATALQRNGQIGGHKA